MPYRKMIISVAFQQKKLLKFYSRKSRKEAKFMSKSTKLRYPKASYKWTA